MKKDVSWAKKELFNVVEELSVQGYKGLRLLSKVQHKIVKVLSSIEEPELPTIPEFVAEYIKIEKECRIQCLPVFRKTRVKRLPRDRYCKANKELH